MILNGQQAGSTHSIPPLAVAQRLDPFTQFQPTVIALSAVTGRGHPVL